MPVRAMLSRSFPSSFGPLVDHARGLALRSRQSFRLGYADLRGHTDESLDQALHFLLDVGACGGGKRSRNFRTPLDQDVKFIQVPTAADFKHIVRRERRLLHEYLLDLRWKYVNAADDEHVIAAPGDAGHTTHGSRGPGQQAGEIAGSITDDWHADFGQRGKYQFASCAIRKHCSRVRVDDFRIKMIFPDGQSIA